MKLEPGLLRVFPVLRDRRERERKERERREREREREAAKRVFHLRREGIE